MYKYNPNGGYWTHGLQKEEPFVEFLNNTLDLGKELREKFLDKEEIQKLIEADKWVEVFEKFSNTTFGDGMHFVNLFLAQLLSFANVDFMRYIPEDKVKKIFCYDWAGKYIKGSEDMFDWYD